MRTFSSRGLLVALLCFGSAQAEPRHCEEESKSHADAPEYFLIQDGQPRRLKRAGRHPARGIEASIGEEDDFHLEGKRYGYTAIGTVDLDFVRGIYFKSSGELYRDLIYNFFLRNLFSGALGRIDGLDRPSWLTGKQVAYVLHAQHGAETEAYWAIDGARFKKYKNELPPKIRNLAARYFSFGYKEYKARLKMEGRYNRRLWSISRQLLCRSVLILKTKQSFMHIGTRAEAGKAAKVPEFDIDAGLAVVWSRGPHELLPMEIFNREMVPRDNDFAGEVSRFVVRKGAVADISTIELNAATTLMVGLGVQDVKVLADEARKKLFSPHGLTVQYPRNATYEDKPEYVLHANPIECVEAQQGVFLGSIYAFQGRLNSLMTALWSAIYSR